MVFLRSKLINIILNNQLTHLNRRAIMSTSKQTNTNLKELKMKELFVTTLEELEELECEYNLEDNGMSGKHDGFHWYQDDEAQVAVYFKLEQ